MKITWNPNKAQSNFYKHGVRFSDAEAVLFDPMAVSVQDLGSIDEPRFVGIGADNIGRLLVVIYTYRGNVIRLISARKANKVETKAYGKGIRF